jgi:hypothetical protein
MTVMLAHRFDNGSTTGSLASARDVYNWLLYANVPLDFEISTLFWDSVKKYLFIPFCLAYAVLPMATTGWSVRGCSATVQAQQTLLSVSLAVPNLCTAFVFQVGRVNLRACGDGPDNACGGCNVNGRTPHTHHMSMLTCPYPLPRPPFERHLTSNLSVQSAQVWLCAELHDVHRCSRAPQAACCQGPWPYALASALLKFGEACFV